MSKRIFGLDILRAIAIMMVVIEHGSSLRYFGAKMGTLGVEIFFVLSGFLIGQILLRDLEQGVDLETLLHFWKRRWIRTIPVYYLVLVLKFILASSIGFKIIWYFIFLQNNIGGIDFFGVSWSLVIEEWFYLLIPFGLLILFYKRSLNKHNIGFYIILVIVSVNVLRYFWVDIRNTPFGGIVGQIPLRLDTMIVGVAFAYLKKYWNNIFLWFANPLGFIIAMIIFHLYVYYWGVATELNQLDTSFWFRTGHFLILSLTIGLLIPFMDTNQKLNFINPQNFIRRIITWISLISYSLYLTHTDIALLVHKSNFLNQYKLNNYIFAMLLAFSLSTILYYYFEKPILKLRDKLTTHDPTLHHQI